MLAHILFYLFNVFYFLSVFIIQMICFILFSLVQIDLILSFSVLYLNLHV